MRIFTASLPLLLLLIIANPVFAQETPRTDVIIEKMSFKLVRGVVNMTTCIVGHSSWVLSQVILTP